MLGLRKRGKYFHADLTRGREHILRGSLGTKNRDAALALLNKLETAIAVGGRSELWDELREKLPPQTYERFSKLAGVQEETKYTWRELRKKYEKAAKDRIKLRKLKESTLERYQDVFDSFERFLNTPSAITTDVIEEREAARVDETSEGKKSCGGISTALKSIDTEMIDEYKVARLDEILQSKKSRGGTSLPLVAAVLHVIFQFAHKRQWIEVNPVELDGRPGAKPTRGAQPLTPEELVKIREHAGPDLPVVKVLRWTGFRGSDAVTFRFSEVDFINQEVDRITIKRNKQVFVPTHPELLATLHELRAARNAKDDDFVLLNPRTGKPFTRQRLYEHMVALGKRAGITHLHTHRFRDTLVVDMLMKKATLFEIAAVIGDTVEMVERTYAKFIRAMRERVRDLLENGAGLEEMAKKVCEEQPKQEQKTEKDSDNKKK